MVRHFFPSFHGDFRLEASKGDAAQSLLTIKGATLAEREILLQFFEKARRENWTSVDPRTFTKDDWDVEVPLEASLKEASKVLLRVSKPKKATLTAVKHEGGKLMVIEGTGDTAIAKLEAEIGKPTAQAAVSVKRPTPCCPRCEPGSVERASEALLSFLTPSQHATWAAKRAIMIDGGLSGHRYIIAHRNSEFAVKRGFIAYDADDQGVLHFHDWSVPAEEEVLAAALILQHREHWLRNEATAFSYSTPRGFRAVFKNPFGGLSDGVESSSMTLRFGTYARDAIPGFVVGELIGDVLADALKN